MRRMTAPPPPSTAVRDASLSEATIAQLTDFFATRCNDKTMRAMDSLEAENRICTECQSETERVVSASLGKGAEQFYCARCRRKLVWKELVEVPTNEEFLQLWAGQNCPQGHHMGRYYCALRLLMTPYRANLEEILLTQEDFANSKNQLPLREFRAVLALAYPQFGSAVCEIARFLVTLPYFYGRMTTDEATELLADKPGYFLLRLSSGQLGALTFSVCRKDKGVRHVRVSRTREGWSILLPILDTKLKSSGKNEGEEREFPNLDSLFLASRVPHRFKIPLAGSPLYAILKKSDAGLEPGEGNPKAP